MSKIPARRPGRRQGSGRPTPPTREPGQNQLVVGNSLGPPGVLWEHPAFDVTELRPTQTPYCLCVFMLNENNRLHAQLEAMKATADAVEIILADGGSTDGSVAPDRVAHFGVRTVLVKRGPGRLGAQMRMAFASAMDQGYAGVVVVDGNNKDDLSAALPRFLERLDEGYDHIQGSRYIAGGHHENTPFLRHLAVKLLHAPMISRAAGFRYTDSTNGFRAYSRRLLVHDDVALFRAEFVGYELHYYLAIEAARLGMGVLEVPVTRVYPRGAKTPTKISFFRGNLQILRLLASTCSGRYRKK